MNLTHLLFLVLLSPILIAQTELTSEADDIFSGSGNCVLCHQSNGTANTAADGTDVSQPTQWRSTMMANAARDPFWQAMVRSESLDLPHLADVIQDKCTNCHVPMGHETAHLNGDEFYTLDEALPDALYMDGVSCTLCHQITPDNFGMVNSFSGGYEISDERVTFGPYENPRLQPMLNLTGYEPRYSPHMDEAELCATCHTLFTPYVNEAGEVAGEFAEQTPFLEWRASEYPAQDINCQSCHMPVLEGESLIISTLPMNLTERSPYFRHHFVGGNTFMLQILKAHGDELGVTADPEHFDATIMLTSEQLRTATAELSGSMVVEDDTLYVTLSVQNKAGHKFPSGFPSRRAWLHVKAHTIEGTFFESGEWDEDGEIKDFDDAYEPHHEVIVSPDEIQIYESVLGDTEDEVTRRLLRASQYLKDNRIPPAGYTAEAAMNDTIGFYGAAQSDPDYVPLGQERGDGSDRIVYKIPINGREGPYIVNAELRYQSIKPAFVDNFEGQNAEEITRFLSYYDAADKTPALVGTPIELRSDQTGVDAVGAVRRFELFQNYPNPLILSLHEHTTIPYSVDSPNADVHIDIYDCHGRRVKQERRRHRNRGRHSMRIGKEHFSPGIYFYRVRDGQTSATKKLVVMP